MIIYHSIKDLVDLSQQLNEPMWKIILQADCQDRMVSKEVSFSTMKEMYRAMKNADASYNAELSSPSLMAGGDGQRMADFNHTGQNICGDFLGKVME